MSRFEIAPWLRYECTGCGLCCRRGFHIWCPGRDRERLSAVDWAKESPALAGRRLFMPTGRGFRFALDEEGCCVFLEPGNRCLQHRRLGYRAKTLTCRMYPVNLVHSGGRVHVGLLFSCPAVVDGLGPPLAKQEALLRDLLEEMDELFPRGPEEGDFAFGGGRRIALPELRALEAAVLAALEDASLPLVRRVLFAAGIADRLDAASGSEFEPEFFHRALDFHRGRALEEAAHGGLPRPRLGRFEAALLREIRGMCSSLAERGLGSGFFFRRWAARSRRFLLAARYLRGAGALPVERGETTFAAAGAVRAVRLPDESEALIARYMRTRIASRGYFGRESWGLDLISGLRATLALPSLVLWHARANAAAAGRSEVVHEDVRLAVMLTDHAVGHLSNLHSGPVRWALEHLIRPGWAQKAVLDAALGDAPGA